MAKSATWQHSNPNPNPKAKHTCTRVCAHFCTFCEGQDFFRSHELVKWIFFIGELEKKKILKNRPSNSISRYIPKRNKKHRSTQKRVHTFIPTLFTKANRQQKRKCPSTGEQLTHGSPRTQEQYAAESRATTQVSLGHTALSAGGQKQKGAQWTPSIANFPNRRTRGDRSRLVIARRWGEGRKWVHGVFLGWWKILKLGSGSCTMLLMQ